MRQQCCVFVYPGGSFLETPIFTVQQWEISPENIFIIIILKIGRCYHGHLCIISFFFFFLIINIYLSQLQSIHTFNGYIWNNKQGKNVSEF